MPNLEVFCFFLSYWMLITSISLLEDNKVKVKKKKKKKVSFKRERENQLVVPRIENAFIPSIKTLQNIIHHKALWTNLHLTQNLTSRDNINSLDVPLLPRDSFSAQLPAGFPAPLFFSFSPSCGMAWINWLKEGRNKHPDTVTDVPQKEETQHSWQQSQIIWTLFRWGLEEED